MFRRLAFAAALTCLAGLPAQAGCGPSPAPCDIVDGTYQVTRPEAEGPLPALVFLHGAGGNGRTSAGQFPEAVRRGYAVIGPDGLGRPDIARAFAPVAGAFWPPHPALDACKGPVRLFQTHGWRDGTVPLEGRPLREDAILQGDVFHAMRVGRRANGCDGLKATGFATDENSWRRR